MSSPVIETARAVGILDSMMQIPQSGSMNVLLAVNGFKSRVFRSLGSKPAILSWDVSTRMVTLTVVSPEGTPAETVFSVKAQEIEYAYIRSGNYIFRVHGATYDMELQHFKGQKAIAFDLLGAEIGGIASEYADAKGQGDFLIAFLQQELPPQKLLVNTFRSRRGKMRLVAGLAIVVIAFMIVLGTRSAGQ